MDHPHRLRVPVELGALGDGRERSAGSRTRPGHALDALIQVCPPHRHPRAVCPTVTPQLSPADPLPARELPVLAPSQARQLWRAQGHPSLSPTARGAVLGGSLSPQHGRDTPGWRGLQGWAWRWCQCPASTTWTLSSATSAQHQPRSWGVAEGLVSLVGRRSLWLLAPGGRGASHSVWLRRCFG